MVAQMEQQQGSVALVTTIDLVATVSLALLEKLMRTLILPMSAAIAQPEGSPMQQHRQNVHCAHVAVTQTTARALPAAMHVLPVGILELVRRSVPLVIPFLRYLYIRSVCRQPSYQRATHHCTPKPH